MEYSKGANGTEFEQTGVLFADSRNVMLGEIHGEYGLAYTKGETVQLWLQEVQK